MMRYVWSALDMLMFRSWARDGPYPWRASEGTRVRRFAIRNTRVKLASGGSSMMGPRIPRAPFNDFKSACTDREGAKGWKEGEW